MSSAVPAAPGVEQIVRNFEAKSIDPGSFDHETHLLVGWWYVQEYNLLDAITRFTGAIKRLTRKLGVSSKYHETITWFYLIKVAERCGRTGQGNWPAFKAANPDLFAWKPSLIQQYYSDALLSSDNARRRFVLPDLAP